MGRLGSESTNIDVKNLADIPIEIKEVKEKKVSGKVTLPPWKKKENENE
ncbi:hypothetical protein [Enterococcus sp. AZ196]